MNKAVLFLALICVNANAKVVSFVPDAMSVPAKLLKKLKSFEPSAALYLGDLDLYLIASDDTTEDDEPLLFLMNSYGSVEKKPIEIGGLKKMTDIESLSQDETGSIFILSSQGLNKNGKDLFERNLFVRAEINGRTIDAQESVELRPLLLRAIQNSSEKTLLGIKSNAAAELDVEASLVHHGELLIGLKNPQPKPGVGLILDIGNVKDIFSGRELQLNGAYIIDFGSISNDLDQISEFYRVGEELLITTTTEAGNSRLWRFQPATNNLILLREFNGFKAEGLTFNPTLNSLLVVFDQGTGNAAFTFETLTPK